MDEFEIKLFENQQIRRKWDAELEDYYYSIVDVIGILTESNNPNDAAPDDIRHDWHAGTSDEGC